jgi:tetratricopeptide (TPR) repeat protein
MNEKKRRAPVSEEIKAQILFQNDHCCCMCHRGPKDGVRIQIHHINEDTSENRPENLAVLCRDCHDMLRDRPWMGQIPIQEEIRQYKAAWEKAVAEKRRHQEFPPVTIKEKITEFDAEGRTKQLIEREISYTNGLAPQAFGISPPVSLTQAKKRVLEDAKQIAKSQPSAERLLPLLDKIKGTEEIGIDDMVLLSRIFLALGDSKFHEGDYAKAEAFYNEALSYGKGANEPEIMGICFYEIGAAVGMQDRHKEALDYFNQVIKMDKDNPGAWFNKGVALSLLGMSKEAVDACPKAIEFGTKAEKWNIVASAYYNMGYDLHKLKRYEEAIAAFLKAIEFGTKAEQWGTTAKSYYNMGYNLDELKKYEEAVDAYLKAIKLHRFLPDKGERIFPRITFLICALGMLSIRDKNHQQARRLAKILLQVHQNGKEDGMTELVVKAMRTLGSNPPQKEYANAFQQFETLFQKAMTRKGSKKRQK